MLTKKTSSARNIWKYAFALPALAFVLILCHSPLLTAQNHTDDIKMASEIQTPPSFPDGEKALLMYVASHVKYRDEARQKREEGTALVRFVVERNGSITQVEGIEGPKLLTGILLEEAVRMVKEMPKWNPAIAHDGNTVRAWYTLPVRFRLN